MSAIDPQECTRVMVQMSWKVFRALLSPSNYATGAVLQERADLLRLYILTTARQTWPKFDPMPEDHLDMPSHEEQRTIVDERVYMETVSLFSKWLKERPPPLPPASPKAPVSEEVRAEAAAKRAVEMTAAQRRAFGFELSVGPSSAGAGAGDGVFLSGEAAPGSVIAFFPGVTFEFHDILMLPGGTRFFQGNENLMARYDKALIDSSPTALKLLPHEALDNPLNVAHMTNHPPRGARPNVVPAPIEFNRTVPRELVAALPNVSYFYSSPKQRALLEGRSGDGGKADAPIMTTDGMQAPSVQPKQQARTSQRRGLADWFRASLADGIRPPEPDDGRPLKGIALVATQPLKDQELFLNYRLNPQNENPEWYVPVDLDEVKRRWDLS